MGNRNSGPTHAVKVAYQVGRAKKWVSKEIGVAFEENDGSFTIKIHKGMALVPQDGVTCKAWPIDDGPPQQRGGGNRRGGYGGGGGRGGGRGEGYGDDDGGDFPEAEF